MNLNVDLERLRRDTAALAAARGSHTPDPTREGHERADALIEGRVWFSGIDAYIEVGTSDIDWSGGQHPHHAWNPQRFVFSADLIAAYRATGDKRYAQALRRYIEDWCAQHPERKAWTPAESENTLDIAVRNRLWGQALETGLAAPGWDDAFLVELVDAIRAQLNWLQENLSPRNNFRLHQAQALLENGIRLRQVADSRSWRRAAVRVFNEAARRQILPDGAHAERTPSYHRGMTAVFAECLDVATLLEEEAFSFDARVVAPMFDYGVASTRPNGTLCGIHDSEGIYEGRRNNDAIEARSRFRRKHGLDEALPRPSLVFPDAQQAFLRDGWGEDAAYLTFDATRWEGAHGHLARNAVQLHAFGRSFVVDPGRIEYEMSNPLGPYGKSTRAHSTLNLNGWNQNTADPSDFRSFHAPGFDVVRARYDGGYWPARFGWWFSEGMGHGLGAVHDRILFWAHGRWALVIDEIMRWDEQGCDAPHRTPALEINWQLAPGGVAVDTEQRTARTAFPDANLHLYFPLLPEGARLAVHEGENDPPRGWVRKPTGGFGGTPAPMVSVEASPMPRFDDGAATVLLPWKGAEPPPVASVTAQRAVQGPNRAWQPGSCTVAWEDGTRETVWWMPALSVMLNRCEDLETDGSLLYTRRNANGALEAAAVADGAWCEGPVRAALLT